MASNDCQQREEILSDYSCYINILNNTDQDLLLADFGIQGVYGKWPLTQPLSVIEAKSAGLVHLKDRAVYGGSEGWVRYEIQVGDKLESFRLDFDDPTTPFAKNSVKKQSSNEKRVMVDVKGYEKKGHPLRADVEIKINTNAVDKSNAEPRQLISSCQTFQPCCSSSNDKVKANFEIGFEPLPGVDLARKYPVHESIAIAAFAQTKLKFPKATVYNNINPKHWEYFRGMIWNDDPSCLLFQDDANDNRSFGLGFEWFAEFKKGNDRHMTKRSHFGDLQFLHGMGTHVGEQPQDTRDKLLRFMSVMYKLACGNQGIAENQLLQDVLPEFFNDRTTPNGHATLRDLILATTPSYHSSNIPFRALGICMHMIEDSYAIGHTSRRLLNPQDFKGRDLEKFITFKDGTWGRWGPIVVFHSYSGQDGDRHSHYDTVKDDDHVPDPRNPNSFNDILGARDAIDACAYFINMYANKESWSQVREKLENTIYAIDPQAKPCNSGVDWPIAGLDALNVQRKSTDSSDVDYDALLWRKAASLESALPSDSMFKQQQQQSRRRQPWLWYVLMVSFLLITSGLFRVLFCRVR